MQFEHATSGWVNFFYKSFFISLFLFIYIFTKKNLVRTRLELCFVGL